MSDQIIEAYKTIIDSQAATIESLLAVIKAQEQVITQQQAPSISIGTRSRYEY
jgi:hypothetical protein